MLALQVNERKFGGGYMIDYSIPQSPNGHKFRQQEWDKDYPGMSEYSRLLNDGWEFFGDNGRSKAQHLSCFNFGNYEHVKQRKIKSERTYTLFVDASKVENVLQKLSRTLPKPVLSTLSSNNFPRLLDANHATLAQNFFTPENTLGSAKVIL